MDPPPPQLPKSNANKSSSVLTNEMDSYYHDKTPATKQPPKGKGKGKGATKISAISILVISLPLLYVSLLHVPPSSLFRDTTFWFLISNSIIFVVASDFASSSAENSPAATLYDEYLKHSRGRAAYPPVLLVREEVVEQARPEPADNADEMKQITEEPKIKLPDTAVAEIGLKGSDESELTDNINVLKDCTIPEPEPEPEPEVVNVKQARLCERSRSELAGANGAEATRNLPLRWSATSVAEKRSCGMEESEYWKMSNEELNERVEEFIRRFNREIRLQERQIMSAVY